tara:strand:- start:835 stop:1638 length:804 start_codon:yes stop_codon:yes gene_type:complete
MLSKKIPVVSIIMNCHNGEKFLHKSLNSILSQTFKNWELVFWDNNSSDKSKTIFSSFKDKRFKYYKSKRVLKLYHARNLAVTKAKGKYICFLDVDDLWSKNKIKEQISFFLNNRDFMIVYSNYYVLNENKKQKNIKIKSDFLPSGFITQKLINNYNIGILTVMCKKKIFKNLNFKKEYNIIGDFDFIIRASIKYKIGCVQKSLAYYRLHSSNFSNNLRMQIYELQSWIKTNQRLLKKSSISIREVKKEIIKLTIKYYIKIIGRVVQW